MKFTIARLTLLAKVIMLQIYLCETPDVQATNRHCLSSIKTGVSYTEKLSFVYKILRKGMHTTRGFTNTRKGNGNAHERGTMSNRYQATYIMFNCAYILVC